MAIHDTHDLEITRRMQARRATLWRCWTDPALLAQWYVPAPWRVTAVVLDLRPGGAFSTEMGGPDGATHRVDGAVLEIAAMERLVWTNALVAGFRPASGTGGLPPLTAVITLRDAPGGGTLYAARALHASAEGAAQHLAMGFNEGWGTVAHQLGAFALTQEDADHAG